MAESMQDPMLLFNELKAMHRSLFVEQFDRLQWEMVASFECSIARKGSNIMINKTTFWLSSERDVNSKMTLVFPKPQAKQFGMKIPNDAVTQATGVSGDIKFILGFANDENVADEAVRKHTQSGIFETKCVRKA